MSRCVRHDFGVGLGLVSQHATCGQDIVLRPGEGARHGSSGCIDGTTFRIVLLLIDRGSAFIGILRLRRGLGMGWREALVVVTTPLTPIGDVDLRRLICGAALGTSAIVFDYCVCGEDVPGPDWSDMPAAPSRSRI